MKKSYEEETFKNKKELDEMLNLSNFICANCFKMSNIPLVVNGTWLCSKECYKYMIQANLANAKPMLQAMGIIPNER